MTFEPPQGVLTVEHARRRRTAAAIVLAAASTASAQWTVINLHPAGATSSNAYAVHAGQQGGIAAVGTTWRACVWAGSAGSWQSLDPAGSQSAVRAAHTGRQAGLFGSHAAIWDGTPATPVILTPSGHIISDASGMDAIHQVGSTRMTLADSAPQFASLWTGSAESWVNLNPPWAYQATAYGVSDGQQVGEAHELAGLLHAILWTGTAESWVDLTPAGATHASAFGVHNGQQVGRAIIANVPHASLWTGSAASWVDLHPTGAGFSIAKGVHRGQQVGYASIGGASRAGLWTGTAASWLDLHSFLPAGFTGSHANAIWSGPGVTYVVGDAYNSATSRTEAVMWVRTSPCYANCDGSTTAPVLNILDFVCFLNRFAAGDPYANCDGSTTPPVLNVLEFSCFLSAFAVGCP